MKKKSEQNLDLFGEAIAIACSFIGVFLLMSLVSYHHGDSSFLTFSKQKTLNMGGRFGASVAELSLQLFGLGAFLWAAVFFLFAGKCIDPADDALKRALQSIRRDQKKVLLPVLSSVFWGTWSLVALCVLLNLALHTVTYGKTVLPAGGWIGRAIAEFCVQYLNSMGATLLASAVLTLGLVCSTPISFIRWVRRASIWLSRVGLAFGRWAMGYGAQSLSQSILKIRDHHQTENVIAKRLGPQISRERTGTEREPLSAAVASAAEKKTAPVHSSSGNYALPPLDLLSDPPELQQKIDQDRLKANSKILESKLNDFNIAGEIVSVCPGPVITMYEFRPGPGVKISQIATLADDLSLALSAQSVRIIAPIPGKSVVGIEIPNDNRERVYLKEVLETDAFQKNVHGIPLAIGKDISGLPMVADLARMPHLLIAGAPGAGKSVFINSLICSLLYRFSPQQLRMVMVDPKQLELNLYEGIPHLLLPVVDDPKKASTALKWAVAEMERRYKIMAKSGMRNLAGFNDKLRRDGVKKLRDLLCPKDAAGMPESGSLAHLFEHDEAGQPKIEEFPYVLVIIDEFADLMMVAPKDIEVSVARLAQKARAAGIHLVVATQRPSVDVITGLIKANLPSRISFQVSSRVDSRTILDSIGAEKLLGQGDMLFIPPGLSRLVRNHGAFVTEEEIAKICGHWKAYGTPVYNEQILVDAEENDDAESSNRSDGQDDPLYDEAISIVRESNQASASMLQRRFKIGYNRAARLIDAMEEQGIVGPADGARPREILM